MKHWILFASLFLSIYAVLTFGCAMSVPKINSPQINAVERQVNDSRTINADLERNRHLWNEKNAAHYTITLSAGEGGNITYPSPALIEVRDDKAISISVNSKSDEALRERYEKIDTINKMFDIIQQGFNKGATVKIKYNKQFGYPEDVFVDDWKQVADGWISIKIKKFEVVQ